MLSSCAAFEIGNGNSEAFVRHIYHMVSGRCPDLGLSRLKKVNARPLRMRQDARIVLVSMDIHTAEDEPHKLPMDSSRSSCVWTQSRPKPALATCVAYHWPIKWPDTYLIGHAPVAHSLSSRPILASSMAVMVRVFATISSYCSLLISSSGACLKPCSLCSRNERDL